MKGIRIECNKDFFEDLEAYLFAESFGEKPKIDRIEVILDTGISYSYKFEYQFGLWYIVTD